VFRFACVAFLCAMTFGASPCRAEPQAHVGADVAGGLRMPEPRGVVQLGLRGDVLFFRERTSDMALGPHLEIVSTALQTLEPGGGVSWLVPLGEPALVFRAGGAGRYTSAGWAPEVVGAIFVGARSYNFHSRYNLAIGGFVDVRHAFPANGAPGQTVATIGLELDMMHLVMPFILIYEAAK
jgi:hypothetical protein